MGCLGCNFIETAPVVLPDGRTVCSSCEDWRHVCEVRMIAGWKTNMQRKEFLEGVAKKRGQASADRLRADVWAEMKGSA